MSLPNNIITSVNDISILSPNNSSSGGDNSNIGNNDIYNNNNINKMNENSTNSTNTPTNTSNNNSSSEKSKTKRKRNRIPLSCTICRKRKVKCDKTRPYCQQCTKTGVSHLCHYMEQSWAEEAERELSKDLELKNLKEKVKQLERKLFLLHNQSNNNSNINSPADTTRHISISNNSNSITTDNNNTNNNISKFTSNNPNNINNIINSNDNINNLSNSSINSNNNNNIHNSTYNNVTNNNTTSINSDIGKRLSINDNHDLKNNVNKDINNSSNSTNINNNIQNDPNSTNNNTSATTTKNKGDNNTSNSDINIKIEDGIILNPKDKYDNDELNLTKQFDMLHIKNNGTIHLGATHWLAIMKGDPYLKLLWGHIFNVREKVNEWYSQRLILNKNNKRKTMKNDMSVIQNNNNRINKNTINNGNKDLHKTSIKRENVSTFISNDENNMVLKDNTDTSPQINKKHTTIFKPSDTTLRPSSSLNTELIDKPMVAPHALPPSDGTMRKCPVTGIIADEDNISSKQDDDTKIENKEKVTSKKKSSRDKSSKDKSSKSDKSNKKDKLSDMELTLASLPPAPHTIHPDSDISKCPVMSQKLMNNSSKKEKSSKKKHKRSDYNSMTHDEIINKVCKLLPPRHIIFQFINKFFKHIYPLIPIIDERNFKNHLEEILVSTVDTDTIDKNPLRIKVTKQSDYCHLGIMIIIIRLTWLSLPSNRCQIKLGAFDAPNAMNSPLSSPSSIHTNTSTSSSSATTREDNILSSYEPSLEALKLVKDYLIKFDKISSISNNNINLTTIQFAIFYKMYISNSPSEIFSAPKRTVSYSISDSNAHDNEMNQILLSSIIQMAFSCGLHRDPDNFPQLNVVSTYHNKDSGTALNGDTKTNYNSSGNDKNSKIKDNQVATERFKHTWRKIWYFIVHLDLEQSLSLGSPRLLRNMKDFSDTKLPSSSKIDYVKDIKELIVIKNFTLFWQIDLVIIAVLNHVLNVFVAKNVRKFELDLLIESLKDLTNCNKSIDSIINDLVNKGLLSTSESSANYQDCADKTYGLPSLEELLSREIMSAPNSTVNTPVPNDQPPTTQEKKFELPHEASTKAMFFAKHLQLRMILFLLNYILFTHYEPLSSQDNGTVALTKRYAQETLNFALDGYRNCLIFFSNVRKMPNSVSTVFNYVNVLLSPHCLDIGHRSLQFIVCLTLRAKCGPIGGINQNIFNSAGEESDTDGGVENNKNIPGAKNLGDLNPNVINDINLEMFTDSQLSDNLIARMEVFEELTSQLAAKYAYAKRTSRSTGFFITLLGGSISKKTGSKSNNWKHPSISGFFKNVPSLALSGDNEQLSRCPVFQDALGFMSPKAIGGAATQPTQLPTSKTSYKPITYTNSHLRKAEDDKISQDAKRRKLNSTLDSANVNKNLHNGNGSVTNYDSNEKPFIPPHPQTLVGSINTLIDTMTMPNAFDVNATNHSSTRNTPVPNGVPINGINNKVSINKGNSNVPINYSYDNNAMSVPVENSNTRMSATPISNLENMVSGSNNMDQGAVNQMMMMNSNNNNNNNNGGAMVMNNNTPSANTNGGAIPIDSNQMMMNQMMMMMNGLPMQLPNDINFGGLNSSMNDLFDASNIMQAIQQFNPMMDVNNMNNNNYMNDMNGMNIHNSTPNNNNNAAMNMNTAMNGGSTNNLMSGGQLDTVDYTNIDSPNSVATGSNNGGRVMNGNNLEANINMTAPNYGENGTVNKNYNMDFFMPKMEDGFTELQDFTIWD